MNPKRLYDMIFRPWPPIADVAALADFIDAQAAFVAQKGIYQYSRARAGHYAKVLFKEPEFIETVDRSRWCAFPLGLAMVGELVEGVLRPHAGEHLQQLEALRALTLSVFDRHPVPVTVGLAGWGDARLELARRLDHVGLHAPKFAKDIPEPFAATYFNLMPIHKKLRVNEAPTIKNYLKATLCNIHEELTQRIDGPGVADQLQARAI